MQETKDAIRALRTKVGLTQKAIGDALGCTQPHVHYLEHNTAKKPRTSVDIAVGLKALCERHAAELAK
ncbi:helix-turn-helix transcriptional regulator [Burkholderia cenocepacia]|uniref:helix-turn-helix domain-containing protein n=1 Tax=Burkholderia cenocepacia TaxID=95486 RepID=UPI0023B8F274|nr:helix-turn-helix transcriptional regulator [Burkholderia cenocepacia]MDF0506581.1 helix-turn-helix transcriptional regulator [Burkholderia cenocepacia]